MESGRVSHWLAKRARLSCSFWPGWEQEPEEPKPGFGASKKGDMTMGETWLGDTCKKTIKFIQNSSSKGGGELQQS